jgi:mannonate dehydratase
MKIGLGLYREQLTAENLSFARQAGATHVIAHLTNYFRGASPTLSAGDDARGWGDCSTDTLWTRDEMQRLVGLVRGHGLELAGLENFSPRFWYDILLDGPEKAAQIEGLKRLVRVADADCIT